MELVSAEALVALVAAIEADKEAAAEAPKAGGQ